MHALKQKIEILKAQEIQAWCQNWDTMARALREQCLALEFETSKGT